MTEKIKWYQEVLELEPNSKVFFSLAKLLDADGQADAAIKTLEKGLERHPEFLEARLLLIELLYRDDHLRACDSQIEMLEKMFARYLGFWKAWAACLARKDADTASLIRFIAAQFTAGPLKLHDVITRGIEAILREKDYPAAKLNPPSGQTGPVVQSRDDLLPEPPVAETDVNLDNQAGAHSVSPADSATDAELAPENQGAGESAADSEHAAAEARDESPDPGAADDNSLYTLRTRSMADVLAEQGDINGALDIYSDLARATADESELADLTKRMQELQQLAGGQSQETEASDPARDKLIGMLEALANRVEARVNT